MSVAELEQLLGRSLGDAQRSRFYDMERQSAETGHTMMMQMSSLLTAATRGDVSHLRAQPLCGDPANSLAHADD